MVQAEQLTAPFPYFGGKRHIAPMVWDLLGDVDAYVEPFAGSAAVLLGRPPFKGKRREILNDLDGWITNLWRSIRDKPDEVLRYAAGPVMEVDNHARLAWLRANHTPDLVAWLGGHPENCDPKAAGWWLSATVGSIGGGSRRGPWVIDRGLLVKGSDPQGGTVRAIPHLTRGRSVDDITPERLGEIHRRIMNVIITQGDWKRSLSKSLPASYGTIGVLLDPPYESRTRTTDGQTLYAHDSLEVSAQVRAWCAKHGSRWRVVLCGYDNEHDTLLEDGWRKVVPPKSAAGSGYNGTDLNGQRDRLWVSPSCLDLDAQQAFDFDALLAHEPEGRES